MERRMRRSHLLALREMVGFSVMRGEFSSAIFGSEITVYNNTVSTKLVMC